MATFNHSIQSYNWPYFLFGVHLVFSWKTVEGQQAAQYAHNNNDFFSFFILLASSIFPFQFFFFSFLFIHSFPIPCFHHLCANRKPLCCVTYAHSTSSFCSLSLRFYLLLLFTHFFLLLFFTLGSRRKKKWRNKKRKKSFHDEHVPHRLMLSFWAINHFFLYTKWNNKKNERNKFKKNTCTKIGFHSLAKRVKCTLWGDKFIFLHFYNSREQKQ